MRRTLILAALAAFTIVGLVACGSSPPPAESVSPTTSQTAGGSVHPSGWGRPAPRGVQLFALAPQKTAAMYDTITLSSVPSNPFALAGYTAGFWPTFNPLHRSYPRAHVVSIAIRASDHADCLDIEPGDASPNQAPSWVWAEKRLGWSRPCLYSDWYEFHEQVQPALARAGISKSQVFEWDADYTGTPHIDVGFDGTQWTDRALGRNLDQSLVLRSFLVIAHPPLAEPKPQPKPKPRPKPKPKPDRKKLLAERTTLRRDLARHNCRSRPLRSTPIVHGRRPYQRVCRVWLAAGQRVNRELR